MKVKEGKVSDNEIAQLVALAKEGGEVEHEEKKQ